jgi:hypothetical protein
MREIETDGNMLDSKTKLRPGAQRCGRSRPKTTMAQRKGEIAAEEGGVQRVQRQGADRIKSRTDWNE